MTYYAVVSKSGDILAIKEDELEAIRIGCENLDPKKMVNLNSKNYKEYCENLYKRDKWWIRPIVI